MTKNIIIFVLFILLGTVIMVAKSNWDMAFSWANQYREKLEDCRKGYD